MFGNILGNAFKAFWNFEWPWEKKTTTPTPPTEPAKFTWTPSLGKAGVKLGQPLTGGQPSPVSGLVPWITQHPAETAVAALTAPFWGPTAAMAAPIVGPELLRRQVQQPFVPQIRAGIEKVPRYEAGIPTQKIAETIALNPVEAAMKGMIQPAYGLERLVGTAGRTFGGQPAGYLGESLRGTPPKLEEQRLAHQNLQEILSNPNLMWQGKDVIGPSIDRIAYSGPIVQARAATRLNNPDEFKDVDMSDQAAIDERITKILTEEQNPMAEMVIQAVFDPINILGLGFDKLRTASRLNLVQHEALGEPLNLFNRSWDAIMERLGTKFATELPAEVLGPKGIWEKVWPFGLKPTRMSNARNFTTNVTDRIVNLTMGVNGDRDQIIRGLTTLRDNPDQVTEVFGRFMGTDFAKGGSEALRNLDIEEGFKSLKVSPEKFNVAEFISEFHDNLFDLAKKQFNVDAETTAIGIPTKIYGRFVSVWKDFLSTFYLGMRPGYVFVNNPVNNWVTLVVDGTNVFKPMSAEIRWGNEVGLPISRLKEGITFMDVSPARLEQQLDKIPDILMPYKIAKYVGGKGIKLTQTIEGWFRERAIITVAKRTIDGNWRMGMMMPDLPAEAMNLGDDALRTLTADLQRANTPEKFITAIEKSLGQGPNVSAARYIVPGEEEAISETLMNRINETIGKYLRTGDVTTFQDDILGLAEDSRGAVAKSKIKDGFVLSEDGEWVIPGVSFRKERGVELPFQTSEKTVWLSDSNELGYRIWQVSGKPEYGLPEIKVIQTRLTEKYGQFLKLPSARWWATPDAGRITQARIEYWNELLDLAKSKGATLNPEWRKLTIDEAMSAIGAVKKTLVEPALSSISPAPLVSDATEAVSRVLDEYLLRVAEGVPSDVARMAGQGIADDVTRGALMGWYKRELIPAWNDMRMFAGKMGERVADEALLNYNLRRNADLLLALGMPYHYWTTRSAVNWGVRLFTKPWAFTNFYRIREMFRKMAPDISSKYQRHIPIPGTNYYVGLMTQIFPFLNLPPWNSLTRFAFQEPEDAKNGVEWFYNIQGELGTRPYTWIDWLYKGMLRLSGQDERAREEWLKQGWLLPLTGEIKGASALLRGARPGMEGLIPPGGWNLEAPLRRALGLPEAPYWEQVYRPTQHVAYQVEAGQITPEIGKEAVEKGLAGQPTPAWEKGKQWAGEFYGLTAVTRFFGIPLYQYRPEEKALREMQAEIKATPDRATWLELIKQHPARTILQAAYSVGDPKDFNQATLDEISLRFDWNDYYAKRDVWQKNRDAKIDSYVRLHPGDTGGLWELSDQLNEGRPEPPAREIPIGQEEEIASRTYKMTPEELMQFRKNEAVSAVLKFYPKAESFTNAAGETDWDAYRKAKTKFFADLKSGKSDYVKSMTDALIAAGVTETMARKQIIADTNEAAVKTYWGMNDTILEAATRVYYDNYPAKKLYDPVVGSQLVSKILTAYKARGWTKQEILTEIGKLTFEYKWGVYGAHAQAARTAGFDYDRIKELQNRYYSLTDYESRQAFRDIYPELVKYWEWNRAYGEAHPDYAEAGAARETESRLPVERFWFPKGKTYQRKPKRYGGGGGYAWTPYQPQGQIPYWERNPPRWRIGY